MKISVSKIIIPKVRASSVLTPEQKAFFEGTVAKYGVLQPIVVRPLPGGRYELIAGKTRLEKQIEDGAQEVEARVIKASAKDALMMHLAENYARGSVDPISTAKVIKAALEKGSSEEEIAVIFNHKPEWVRFMVGLLELSPEYQQALQEGTLKVTHIREALRLPNLKEADAALQAALTLGWSTSVMHHYVSNRLAEFEAAKVKSETLGVEVPPPPPEPKRLVKYGQCLVCGEMVPREQISLPAVCEECYMMAKYVVSQCGKGDPGMQRVYKALETLQAWEAHQRQYFLQRQMQTQPREIPSPRPGFESPEILPEKATPIADDKLRNLIKKLLREELERASR